MRMRFVYLIYLVRPFRSVYSVFFYQWVTLHVCVCTVLYVHSSRLAPSQETPPKISKEEGKKGGKERDEKGRGNRSGRTDVDER